MRSLRAKLLSMFRYNPITGDLIWMIPPHNKMDLRGKVAGSKHTNIKDGVESIRIGIDGRIYDAHRLVWIMRKNTPVTYITHINGDGTDNRIENLAERKSLKRKTHRGAVGFSNTLDIEESGAYFRNKVDSSNPRQVYNNSPTAAINLRISTGGNQ